MANILIFSFPYWGHTQVLLKIAHRLSTEGHVVYLDIDEDYRVPGDRGIRYLHNRFARYKRHSSSISVGWEDSLYFLADGICACRREYEAQLGRYRALQPDLVLYDAFAVWGKEVAEALNVPGVASVTMQPYALENMGNAALAGEGGSTGRQNRLNGMYERILRKKYFQARPVPLVDMLYAKGTKNIVYTHKRLCIRPETLDDSYVFAGPIIDQCLCTGVVRNHIVISFGSILNNPGLLDRCIQAMAQLPYEIYVNAGPSAGALADIHRGDPRIHIKRTIEQLDLLPGAKLFITHAGHNSMVEAALCGTPMLAIAQAADGYCNARIIEESGLGRQLHEGAAPGEILAMAIGIMGDARVQLCLADMGRSFREMTPMQTVLSVLNGLLREKVSEEEDKPLCSML